MDENEWTICCDPKKGEAKLLGRDAGEEEEVGKRRDSQVGCIVYFSLAR